MSTPTQIFQTQRHFAALAMPRIVWSCLLTLGLWACDTARPLPEADQPKTDAAKESFAPECHACHGNPNSPAPPRAVGGSTDTKERGVGAHTTHLGGAFDANPVACAACHKVPESIWDIDHIDPTPNAHATVTFGGLALAGGATPTYDPDTLTCSNVYCHGSKVKAPGPNSSPVWNLVDASQRQCGSCHGAPPAEPHPQTGDCVDCHALTAGPNKTIAHKENHINGKVDVKLSSNNNCSGCHGAPPVNDKHPKTTEKCEGCHATTVNADQQTIEGGAHMNGKTDVVLSANAPCSGCHGAPPVSDKHPKTSANCNGCHATTVDVNGKIQADGPHNNGKVDVILSDAPDCAGCHGNPPVSDKHPVSQGSCSGCHAETVDAQKHILANGPHNNGKVDVKVGKGADCAGCHGAPPVNDKHPKANAVSPNAILHCDGCHSQSVDANEDVIEGGAHNNGKTDVNLAKTADCNGCHAAPPVNDKHPKVDPLHPQVVQKCDGCHAATVDVNEALLDNGAHMNGKTDVVIGTKTSACSGCHGAPPVNDKHPKVNPANPQGVLKCDGCHSTTVDDNEVLLDNGAHMNGKTDIVIGAKTTGCAGCHGAPPVNGKHPVVDPAHPEILAKCDGCHGSTVNAQEQVIDGGTHMNGATDVVLGATTACSGCHGAPPINGKHPVADPANPTAILACNGCHDATVDASQKLLVGGAHMNGLIDVKLGATPQCAGCHGAPPTTAKHPKADPANPAGILACESCHALTAAAGQTLVPGGPHNNGTVEIKVVGGQNCNACHGAPPVNDKHPKVDPANPDGVLKCDGCHATTVDGQEQIIDGGAHMNGVTDVELSTAPNCSGCHGAPPVTDKHPKLNPADPLAITQCETCHALSVAAGPTLIPGGAHRNGTVDVKVVGGADCTACHEAPPTTNHPKLNVAQCSLCHGTSVDTQKAPIDGGTHNNGTVNFSIDGLACTTCHGAPPASDTHPKMNACEKCHSTTTGAGQQLVPGGTHVNGTINVALPVAGPWVNGVPPAECSLCHGTPGGSPAPAPDVNGNTDPTLPSVGAHAAHLFGKNYSNGGIECATCHVLPTTVDQTGHLLGLLDSVQFPNGKAAGPGQKPDYNPASLTCNAVYCHGSTLDGGSHTQPVWNQPNLACDSCHGLPPSVASGHPPVDPQWGIGACALCHSKTVNVDGTLNLKDGWHINGMVNP